MLTAELAGVLVTAAVSIGGSWLIGRQAASSHMLGQLTAAYKRITDLESRVELLEGKREEDAGIKRRQGDHIDVLEAHIWNGLGPPPPPRPAGV